MGRALWSPPRGDPGGLAGFVAPGLLAALERRVRLTLICCTSSFALSFVFLTMSLLLILLVDVTADLGFGWGDPSIGYRGCGP